MKEIANRIRSARIEQKMSQQTLADRLGFKSRSVICEIENDRYQPSLDALTKIAKALNVDLDYLIFGDEESKKDEINRLFDLLPPEQQESVLQFLRSMIEARTGGQ